MKSKPKKVQKQWGYELWLANDEKIITAEKYYM